jgi:type II secretory pathway pseudopilin PulG
MKNKKAQVWIETAIYTLIGLTIIGILLGIAYPQIQKIQDRSALSQATGALNDLDEQVSYITQSPGNIAVPKVKVSRGKYIINSSVDEITYILDDSILEYTELDTEIKQGNFYVKTIKYGKKYNIYITRRFSGINITYKDNETNRYLEISPIPYNVKMESKPLSQVDITLI